MKCNSKNWLMTLTQSSTGWLGQQKINLQGGVQVCLGQPRLVLAHVVVLFSLGKAVLCNRRSVHSLSIS